MVYSLLRHFLFTLNAENAHNIALKWLKLSYRSGMSRFFPKPFKLPCKVMGLTFKNPVGLAAGFDKNGDYIDALFSLGFGFIELGTVTPRPQPGNPSPRLFRLPEYGALINRMGFNNKGVDYLVSKIKACSFSGIIGVNIGKNFSTDVDDAYKDYLCCLEKVYPYANYVAVNISSPNTPGLRKLQHEDHLKILLENIRDKRNQLGLKYHKYVPIVIKIAPDMSDSELFSFVQIFKEHNLDGIIAANTTLARKGIETSKLAQENGGLSGAPLKSLAIHVLNELKNLIKDNTALIASGGIMTPYDAFERIQAGANLVQLYTGLVYSGPKLVQESSKKISGLLCENSKL